MRPRVFLPLVLLAAAAWAEPRRFTFVGDADTVDLTLDFKAEGPFADKYELSGDYLDRQGDFRIFAEDYYQAKAVSRHHAYGGAYEGYAFDHYLDVHYQGDPPAYDTYESEWNAHLVDGKGDTLEFQGAITPQWNDSLRETRVFFWDIRFSGGDEQCSCFRLVASDSVRLDFPVPDGMKPVPILAKGFLRIQERRLLVTAITALKLRPPDWASGLEVFNLSGRKVFSTRISAPRTPVNLPRALAKDVLYVKYFRD